MNKLFSDFKGILKLILLLSIIIVISFFITQTIIRTNEHSSKIEVEADIKKEPIIEDNVSNESVKGEVSVESADTSKSTDEKEIELSVEEYLNIILSSPKESSSPKAYIEAHREEYDAILAKDTEALSYMFTEFEKGDQNGLKGVIMEGLCRRILAGNDIKYEATSPQDWYNEIKEYTVTIATKNSYEFVKEMSPKLALLLDKDNYYYAFDMVMFADCQVEIAGRKLGYSNEGIELLDETLTSIQIEQLMYRAVIFYKSVYHRDFAAVKRFSSDQLNKELDKWDKNEEVRSGIDVMMTLNNYVDVDFPSGIKAPVHNNENYVVTLLINETISADVTFIINSEGIPEVVDFQIDF